jgi:hypothetical protein
MFDWVHEHEGYIAKLQAALLEVPCGERALRLEYEALYKVHYNLE